MAMHAVVFEVFPRPERREDYLALAAALRPELERIDGFISVERFASAELEGKLLSFSLWRDEAALARWRAHTRHRRVQQLGRTEIFQDYRLRVAEVVGEFDGTQAATARVDLTRSGEGRPCAVILETNAPTGGDLDDEPPPGLLAHEHYESLYTEGKRLVLTSWAGVPPAQAWIARLGSSDGGSRLRLLAIERDYGMFERAEAPQP